MSFKTGAKQLFSVKPSLANEASKGQISSNPVKQIIVFFIVFLISTLLQSLVPMIYIWDEIMGAMRADGINMADSDAYTAYFTSYDYPDAFMLITLFSTGIGTLFTMLYCRGFERRKISSMGLVKRNFLRDYGLGALIGASMLALAVLLCLLCGSVKISVNSGANIGLILLFLLGFLIQGMYEEVIFRGYLFISTASNKPVLYGIMLNSVLFSAAHSLNSGVGVIAFVNIGLFGVLMSLTVLKTESLWCACALHSLWNFFQGNVFGILTSGTDMGPSLLCTEAKSGRELISGGSFGIEGGLAATFVLVLAVLILIALKPPTPAHTE